MRPVTCYFPIKAGQEGKRCVIHFPHAKHVARKSRWVGTSGEASGGELVGTSGETSSSGLPLVGRRLNLSEPESIPVMIPVPRSTRHLPGETYPLDINDIHPNKNSALNQPQRLSIVVTISLRRSVVFVVNL